MWLIDWLFEKLTNVFFSGANANDPNAPMERIVAVVCNDNIDWACNVIEQAATEKVTYTW
jgi:hypothetical protein